jgi:hypothetical protein
MTIITPHTPRPIGERAGDAGDGDGDGDDNLPARAIARLASWKLWLVSASLFTLSAGVFFVSSAPFAVGRVTTECGNPPPDVQFTSSAADVEHFLAACGEAGREAYRNMLLADLFYPAVFGLFLASSLAMTMSRVAPSRLVMGRRPTDLAWLPFLGAGFDYLENALAWRALTVFPQPAATTTLLGVASAAKTTTFWLAGLILLGSIGVLAVRAVRSLPRPATS